MDQSIKAEKVPESPSIKAKSERRGFEKGDVYEQKAIETSRGKTEKQYFNFRRGAILMALSVIIAGGVLEVYILLNIEKWDLFGDSLVFLVIAPIASITFIVISVMIGVFKRLEDQELKASDAFLVSRVFRGGGEG